jgi:hypothetical protein
MPQEYTPYQLKSLLQLADFRNKFYETNIGKKKKQPLALKKSIDAFIDIFCQNHFADSDYTILQKELCSNYITEQRVNQISMDVILKWVTYIIWTDKTIHAYFIKKIEDKTIQKLLTRLECLALSHYKEQKIINDLREKNINVVAPLKQQLEPVLIKTA